MFIKPGVQCVQSIERNPSQIKGSTPAASAFSACLGVEIAWRTFIPEALSASV